MAVISATEASRNFSALLNRVAAGEQIEITRAGATVATIARRRDQVLPGRKLVELLNLAPPADEDFANDVRQARASIGPESSPWPF